MPNAGPEHSGTWLFRWRGYLPLSLLALVIMSVWDYRYPVGQRTLQLQWELACLALGLCGLAVRCWAIGFAAPGTSGRSRRTQRADDLNTTGLYSVLRNPLYFGNYIMWISVAMLTRTFWLPLCATVVFVLFYRRIVHAEEAFLRSKFGSAFDAWASVTPAFIPDFRRWRPAERSFACRRVLKSERSSVFSLIVAFSAMDVLVGSRMTGRISMHAIWIALLAASALMYAAVEVMKKREKNRRKKESAARAAADPIESISF